MRRTRIEVLLGEDNPCDAELILEALGERRLGAAFQLVADGVEALDFLFCRGAWAGQSLDAMPRLILLDVKLPKVNGLEVLQAIKSDPRTWPIPVVMLTSSNIEWDVARAYRLGANSYIQKPVNFERLRATMQQVGQYWLTLNEPPPASTVAQDDARAR